ncbi:DUF6093 family protein [Mycetocola saprophilus]|uniref:DUF6093 family protein n=1 Tax=Mycetocola saprophilus TaxID=76636 RepID=UPI003BF2CD6C
MGRRLAVARMSETVEIGVEVEGPPDPVTLEPTNVMEVHYRGPARWKYPNLASFDRNAGGQQFTEQTLMVHLPTGAATEVATDDTVIVTASTADTSLIGRRGRIAGRPQSGQTTAHRYPVEELS